MVLLLLIGHDWSREASLSRRGSDVAAIGGAGRVEISSADGLWHGLSSAIRSRGLLVIGVAVVHICGVSAMRLIEPVLASILCYVFG